MHVHVVQKFCLFILLAILPSGSSLSLYSPDDPLHELDNSNFESILFRKSNAWIIEFYNNWCGHCIRFAPTWKEFSRDVRTWRNVIDVAVMNCADKVNVKVCRDYDVTGYPTVKIFKPFINESDKGVPLKGDRDIESMENSMVDYLELYQDEDAPTDWPDLHPLETTNIQSITNQLKDNEGSLILLLEHSNSTLGKKVILDLSFQSSVVVRRVLATNEDLLHDLKIEITNSTAAIVLKIDKHGQREMIGRYTSDTNSSHIRDEIFEMVVGYPRHEIQEVFGSKNKTSIKVSIRDSVHMTDLENSLRYLLYQEIGVIKHIYGDRLDALKNFIHILKNYFPGKALVMGYISKLNDWISNQKNITGDSFVLMLDELQTEDEYLPEMKDFVGCKGSEPRYRGYPCSLWTLFHTLTVQAHITDEETAGGLRNDAMTVLPNIKNYIKYFFTCEECVYNFNKMDQKIDSDASTPSAVVLWLWGAHNRVNRRLSGDITEDPQHPKVQFPSPNMCPTCRLKNEGSEAIKWDEVQVLRFLTHFYGRQNIIISETSPKVRHQSSYTSGNSSMVIPLKNASFYEKWSFQWFTSTDISLCLSLYIVSVLLLFFIFLLFRQRRRRKKNNKMYKYFNIYP